MEKFHNDKIKILNENSWLNILSVFLNTWKILESFGIRSENIIAKRVIKRYDSSSFRNLIPWFGSRKGWKSRGVTFFSNWNRSRSKYLELSDSLLYCTHNGRIHTCVLDEIRMGAKTNTVSTAYKFTRFVFREHPSCLINFAARYDSLSVNVYAYVNYRTSIVTLVPDNRAFVERNL